MISSLASVGTKASTAGSSRSIWPIVGRSWAGAGEPNQLIDKIPGMITIDHGMKQRPRLKMPFMRLCLPIQDSTVFSLAKVCIIQPPRGDFYFSRGFDSPERVPAAVNSFDASLQQACLTARLSIRRCRRICARAPVRSLKYFGAGAIVASVTIALGETIFAARSGALFGYTLLWCFVAGALMKGVQVYSGMRHMVLTGEHPMTHWGYMPGPKNWVPIAIGLLSLFCFPFGRRPCRYRLEAR